MSLTREQVQPYFRAFMIERGYRCSSEAPNGEYVFWNMARWREFGRLHGLSEEESRFHRDQFAAWLEKRSIDHVAREFVEGRA